MTDDAAIVLPSEPHRRLFLAAFGAWLAILLIPWILSPPLGHDEAAYAIGATAWLDGRDQLWLYRSVGMHGIAAFGVLAGGSELAFRAPAIVIAIGFLFAVYRLARIVTGPIRATWVIVVLVGMHGLAQRGHEMLSDLPSTGCIVMALAVLVTELERADGPRFRLALAAVWLALAFYLRYGSCVPIALVIVTAIIVWWRPVTRRPLPVLATAALFALLLAPHIAYAIGKTGSPIGIIELSSGVPRRAYIGEGLVTYLLGNAFASYGVIATPVLLAGLVGIVGSLRRKTQGSAQRPLRCLWFVAVGQTVVLGLMSHGTARYIYVALVLLLVLGVDTLARVASARLARRGERVARRTQRAAVTVCVLAWIGCATAAVAISTPLADWREPVVDAARVVARDANGRPCHVTSRRFAQIMWYAGCARGGPWPPRWALDNGDLIYRVWITRSAGTPDVEAFRRAADVPLDVVDVGAEVDRYAVQRITATPEPSPPR